MVLAFSATLTLVNLCFAAIALGVGFVAGGWFLGGRPSAASTEDPSDAEKALQDRLAVERALFASARLQDLATGVASDVGEHNTRVEQINADLEALKTAPVEQQTAEVSSALQEIIDANAKLQERLSKAEQQIQAQAEEIKAHESEARTDSLTNLANRRAFDDHLAQRFAEWKRKATPFSLMILDVDHFKKFNDTHGHQAGDEVLRGVAKALTATVREMDIPCRYGGEEFSIVLPATVARDACGLAERVRKAIEELRINFEGKTLSVTASVGLAQVNEFDDPARILKRADDALYTSKDEGRNCGHLHEGELCVPVVGTSAAVKPSPIPAAAESVATQVLDSLPTRTMFAEELRRRISASERTGEPLCVMAVEFEGYDQVIAEYGEAVATLTLDSVAVFLTSTLREMDLVGRLDHGRLVVMLPTADVEAGANIASRATTALAGCSVPIGEDQLSLATNIGVAQWSAQDTAASLISRAQQAIGQPQPAGISS